VPVSCPAQRDRCADGPTFGSFLVHYAAGTEPRLDEYRLRYHAFVEEHRWLSPGGARNRLERDQFDAFSCSAVIVDRVTGEAAACQRLILPEHLPDGFLTNAERVYRPLGPCPIVDFTSMRDTWAEASRLTIAPPYRAGSSRRGQPAMLAISYASLALAVALGRRTLFTISDPRTARLTRRIGIEMRQVGQLVDFHGTRGIFRIDIADVLAGVPAEWRDTVDLLVGSARRAGIARAFHHHTSPQAA
jgi:N-acyl-L-homoserine lactone synthetase